MDELRDCKVVQDLFPSYVDGLTNEKTNQYIEEHLKECEECKEILDGMKTELELDITKKDSREVKYIKRFKNKVKILKTILLVILLIFIFSVGRKMIIISSLNNKISNYTVSTNYYTKLLNYSGDSMAIIECYKKDDKYIKRQKFLSEDHQKFIYTDYYNGKTINTYIELEKEDGLRKIARINKNDNINEPIIPNAIRIDYPLQLIATSLLTSIRSVECNGKECYQIVKPWFSDRSETIYYIEKETGLTIRIIGDSEIVNKNGERHEMITDFQYEFDIITDNDFIEPDISQYEIEE